jgi:hypothetical protein
MIDKMIIPATPKVLNMDNPVQAKRSAGYRNISQTQPRSGLNPRSRRLDPELDSGVAPHPLADTLVANRREQIITQINKITQKSQFRQNN